MTLKEADEVAKKGLPVLYQGIVYERITEIGHRYAAVRNAGAGGRSTERIERSSYVQLLDKCDHSVVYADPALCTLLEELKQEGANT